MKINFKKLKVFPNIERGNSIVIDVHRNFADMIYQRGTGIAAHSLAMKIYNSDGDADYSDEEVEQIKDYAQKLGTPMFIDAIDNAIKRSGME